MKLLPVKKKDLFEITALLEQNRDALGFSLLPLEEKLTSPSFMLLRLVEKSSLAGFVEVEIIENRARLNCLVISKSFRGLGLGRKALELLLCFLRKNGFENISVFVDTENSIAKKLYEKTGFCFVGLWQGKGIEVEELQKEFCGSPLDIYS